MAIEPLVKISAKSETEERGAFVDVIWNDPIADHFRSFQRHFVEMIC
jgi:hypothetical protein